MSLAVNAKEPSYFESTEVNEQANYYSEKASENYNPELAKSLYLKAAKNNYYIPYYNYYMVCKEQGEANCDMERAIDYLTIAAEHNISDAQNEMGSLYWNGLWRKKDIDKSIYWYKKSAKNNNIYGQYNTGRILYIYKQKTSESRFYLASASKSNFIPAKDLYARYLLENGNHDSDDILAVKLLKDNIKFDYYSSYYRLALCYIYAVGVEQNLKYAEFLLEGAKKGGIEEASRWLDRVRSGEFN